MILKTEIIKDIRQGFETAYINGTLASNLEYKPSFVSNNPKEGKKVISTIEEELLRCEHFQISVAFITSLIALIWENQIKKILQSR